MAQQDMELFHKLTVSEREAVTVTGVQEVVGFDESAVQLNTSRGELWIHGSGLRLKNLDPTDGCLQVTGSVTALIYQQTRARGGWLSRIFG